jgi:3-deoxy-D-manno-octulosonate 8-phosphate phosphatase (KDO 8-P phosphatase)
MTLSALEWCEMTISSLASTNYAKEKAKSIKLLGLDVDGVLTDGKLYFSAQGDELKAFSILDGLGIKMLQKSGVQVVIITGRESPLTARRASDLGIDIIRQGREDKKAALLEICAELSLSIEQCAYMGDDLPDLSAIRSAGLGLTVPNAYEFVKDHADFCTEQTAGQGAVREVCDLILNAQGNLNAMLDAYLT